MTAMRNKPALYVALVIFLAPAMLYGEIYRWVDEDGRVHFSENAPARQTSEEITSKLDEVGNFFDFTHVVDIDWYIPSADYQPAEVEVKIELVNYQLNAAEYNKIRDGVSGIYETYSRWFTWPRAPRQPVVIKIFGKFDAFEQYQQEEYIGHSTTRSHYSHQRKEVVMLGTEFKGATLGVLFHEASHAVFAMKLKSAPKWINEGLAECFEGTQVRPDKIYLHYNPAWVETMKHKLREGSLRPMEEYLRISNKQWSGSSARVERTYYIVAWSMMSSLLSSRHGIDTLRVVLANLPSKSWRKEDGLVALFNDAYPGGVRKMDQDWRHWIESM